MPALPQPLGLNQFVQTNSTLQQNIKNSGESPVGLCFRWTCWWNWQTMAGCKLNVVLCSETVLCPAAVPPVCKVRKLGQPKGTLAICRGPLVEVKLQGNNLIASNCSVIFVKPSGENWVEGNQSGERTREAGVDHIKVMPQPPAPSPVNYCNYQSDRKQPLPRPLALLKYSLYSGHWPVSGLIAS